MPLTAKDAPSTADTGRLKAIWAVVVNREIARGKPQAEATKEADAIVKRLQSAPPGRER